MWDIRSTLQLLQFPVPHPEFQPAPLHLIAQEADHPHYQSNEIAQRNQPQVADHARVVQHATTDLMITPIPEQIAYISTILPLLPGDVIVSGTPGGVGAKRRPPLFMRPGDVAEVEISGVGVLRNPVIAEAG